MRWIKFPNGRCYTFASDIQNFAEKLGYRVPCESDGTRHPGTDCNAKMRTVIKDMSLRRAFNVDSTSVVDVRLDDVPFNVSFIQWLIEEGFITDAYLKIGILQLYSPQAVNALVCVMLKSYETHGVPTDNVRRYSGAVKLREHNFEKKKNRPKASLFSNKGGIINE